MPNYDYDCPACGPFTAMRPMARFRDACACPDCGAEAARTFLSAPAVTGVDPGGRTASETTRPSATELPRSSAAHPAVCGCCMRRLPLPGVLSAGGRAFTSHGPVRRGGP